MIAQQSAPPANRPASGLRIILHQRAGKGRQTIDALAAFLAQDGTPAAGYREVPGETTTSRVRYFWPDDRAAAERLKGRLETFLAGRERGGLKPPIVQDFTRFTPRPSRGTLEIWLADAAR